MGSTKKNHKNKKNKKNKKKMKKKKKKSCNIIKRGNNYVCISNDEFKFLDICNYLPQGTSYTKFLKAFEIEEKNVYFCYEYLDSFEKLSETELPPYPSQAWYSTLKEVDLLNAEFEQWEDSGCEGDRPNTGQENYDLIVHMWEKEGWENIGSFLQYYCSMDTIPFVKGVEKLMLQYFEQGIDVFKTSISVPGVARIKMMQYAQEKGIRFSLINAVDKDLFYMFKSQIAAGPSIIFNRLQIAGETKMESSEKKCGHILGYDANSLYLMAIGMPMPCEDHVRRKKEYGFIPMIKTRYSLVFAWLRYVEERDGVQIRSALSHGVECTVGKYKLDGVALYPNGKIKCLEFDGCYFHGHHCYLNKNITPASNLRQNQTKEKRAYLISCGYEVETMRECVFLNILVDRPDLREYIATFKPDFYRKHPKNKLTEEELITAIKDGTLFGFALVDISVPPHLTDYFEAFPPLFANHTVYRKDIGAHMQSYLENTESSFKFSRLLISGKSAKDLLLSTDLLQWYLNHGLVITKITEVIEYKRGSPFQGFVDDVTARRKEGEKSPNKKIIAETYKLLGNSG